LTTWTRGANCSEAIADLAIGRLVLKLVPLNYRRFKGTTSIQAPLGRSHFEPGGVSDGQLNAKALPG